MGFLLLAAFLDIAISSYVLWFVLPRGVGLHDPLGLYFEMEQRGTIDEGCGLWGVGPVGNAWTVFEWPRFIWLEFHAWIGVAIAIIILIHLLLHWSWLVEVTKRAKSYAKRGLKAIAERYATVVSLFVLFIFEVFSGCVIWLILPRGRSDYYNMTAGVGRTFWGLQRNVWSDIHAWVAIAIVSIIIVHIIIHWRWVLNITLGKNRAKKIDETAEVARIREADKTKATWPGQPGYLPRAGMFIGLVGAIAFTVLQWKKRVYQKLFQSNLVI